VRNRVHNPTHRTASLASLLARLGICVFMAVALGMAGNGWQVAVAAPARPADTAISGVVVNGTHHAAPVGGLQVTLQATGGNGTHDIGTATTDAHGRFVFANLANAQASVFAVYTRFQQGLYSTGAITVDNGTQDVTLTVFDATNSDAALRIASVTALVRDPRPRNGLIGVGEVYTFHNSGDTAFVGAMAPANGQPMGLLRFALPPGASNVKLGAGFDGTQTAQVATGFGATATIPPGDAQFALAFDVPYTGTACALPLKVAYPTDHVLLLVPPAIQVETNGLTARGPVSSAAGQYSAFTRDGLAATAEVHTRLAHLPPAGEPPVLDFPALVALAVALGMLLAILLALYLRRGDLAIALRLVPASARTQRAGTQLAEPTATERDAERVRLLRRLIALQKSATAGRLSASQYQLDEGQTRAALRALLASIPLDDSQPAVRDQQVDQPEVSEPELRTMEAIADTSDVQPATSGAAPSRVLSGGGQ
jgi:5-hydroxyisourate hydrolase-like protein (transthyretin family)